MKTFSFYIVEDEPIITASIKTMLKKRGFKVVGTSDEYETALSEILKHQPFIVLLDIRLEGEKNGIDLALKLDQFEIKYFYLSSLTDPITREQIKETTPLGFIDKPFTEFGLLNKILNYSTCT